ncbi:putative glycoside hydrolase, family 28, pectin lyase/virulence factor [Helianthus annuus]|uniref:Glycoside hydrolase, family 28, pectin lyase/virulence factor n=1 Tax=Helianthus annuus TaxID=4232 RepID=A0A9K3HAZ9_HELAN|nr:putative glycoside hydrolase, family 28, pectin lyase/virulence factor [Helianthus annuus]KAJ0475934.1 putative glycoside hydrolase, family 28, pectin lyase/virulence factor [Helianthus annuus]KAJ0496736.1 putative glycoside hydrolase, family 28, pectin lyase/virulence factor [Helianthus annuus]
MRLDQQSTISTCFITTNHIYTILPLTIFRLTYPHISHLQNSITTLLIFVSITVSTVNCRRHVSDGSDVTYAAINCRKHTAFLTDFGGVGDGKTSNTAVFRSAIQNLSQFENDGGSQLIVPPGKWLTGSFNLTSHFTLFIQFGAVVLASQDEGEYPLIEPLPSYGAGRDGPGGRFSSLIGGSHLTDVVITGDNGTIDGQGSIWWDKFHQKKLKNTRPYLIEPMYSNQIQISNLTLVNSPSWFVHPDVFIVSGDDCIAVKSGWDEYGIKFGMPTEQAIIRRLTCISPDSAVIALGSEMSGGIKNIRAEDITAINSESGVRIKTGPGRGAYVTDIFVDKMTLHTMKYVFWTTGAYGQHPDPGYDPKALPKIDRINYRNVVADDVQMAGNMGGIEGDPFTGFCLSNVTIGLSDKPKKVQWNCTDVSGVSSNVTPEPCDALVDKGSIECEYPSDPVPIDTVQMQTCSFSTQKVLM